MNTIIQGNKERLKEYKYFECTQCGWAGRADKDEYRKWDYYNASYYYIPCPCCNNDANEVDKERKQELIKIFKGQNTGEYWKNR